MSTAGSKSKVVPTSLSLLSLSLLKQWQHKNRTVEVWKTTCIVTNFGKPSTAPVPVPVPVPVVESASRSSTSSSVILGGQQAAVLINPANPELSGVSKFPYFPRGGPAPPHKKDAHRSSSSMGYVSLLLSTDSAMQGNAMQWYYILFY
jgi:hypothetical protein